jgi:hypothetical protein
MPATNAMRYWKAPRPIPIIDGRRIMHSNSDVLHMTVNEVVRHHPATLAVFNRHGIDSCCGGMARVADAASRDGADLSRLGADLALAIRAAVPA